MAQFTRGKAQVCAKGFVYARISSIHPRTFLRARLFWALAHTRALSAARSYIENNDALTTIEAGAMTGKFSEL